MLGSMTDAVPPFRDNLAAAVERVERLARENSALRARLAARRLDWVQWMLVGVITCCVLATASLIRGVAVGALPDRLRANIRP